MLRFTPLLTCFVTNSYCAEKSTESNEKLQDTDKLDEAIAKEILEYFMLAFGGIFCLVIWSLMIYHFIIRPEQILELQQAAEQALIDQRNAQRIRPNSRRVERVTYRSRGEQVQLLRTEPVVHEEGDANV
uniref:Uncharacterized protein n=1 Tax=Caenorhabditis tropicalis TaxID=1561998 RepID=A0A1I7UUC1_9PELO